MSKVFRLHTTGGRNDSTDWFDCLPYDSSIINDIKDPDGADARKQITSIPSPFARIDLVKTAFEEVVRCGNLDGNSIYHRMVSETLDVAEIFFNFDKLKDKFDILVWDRDKDLNALKGSHSNVAGTLEMFMNQDKAAYNFDLWQQIFILRYTGPKHKEMQIVGMTSPCTLFCSTANDLSAISENVHFGQDRPFDNHFQPLYKRDEHFIKYLYTFRNHCQNFSSWFKEVDDYMTMTYNQKLDDELKEHIDKLTSTSIMQYQPLKLNGAQTVQILGQPFHQMGIHPVQNSDFEIRSSIFQGLKPLVLPCESGNAYKDWMYTQDKWGSNQKAPYYDTNPIDQRTLPFDNAKHPYLTISDLLEDTLVEIPDSETVQTIKKGFNRKWFFDGNRNDKEKMVTLLPLKPLFFEYFTVDELINGIEGKPLINIHTNASGYRVQLQIPVAKGVVEFERLYMASRDEKVNKGECLKLDDSFAFALLTPVRFTDEQNAYFRVAARIQYDLRNTVQMKAYCGSQPFDTTIVAHNDREENVAVTRIMVVEKKQFDFIQITDGNQNAKGILIPRMRPQQQAGAIFRFAVDFGTTNTHIEYRKGDEPARPFSMEDGNSVMQYLCDYGNKRYEMDADLMPCVIAPESTFSFPMRSALCEPSSLNRQQPVLPMAHVNPAFTYEKRQTYSFNNIRTNLKWDTSDTKSADRAKNYIESLMLILRNKVAIEGGSLGDTHISWFYPTSMQAFMRNQLEEVWTEAYQRYFGNNLQNIHSFTESEAPYIAYRSSHDVSDNMVTIDIGGGTTDVVMVTNGRIEAITSFRFAADVLFGSALTGQGELNGILKHFKDEFINVLENNALNDLKGILDKLLQSKVSENVASFLFSLRDNREIAKKGIAEKVDFNAILRKDTDFKIAIILFYTAIVYHVMHILKIKNIGMPRVIAFSGNGSKVLRTIGNDKTLADFTRNIVEQVFNRVNPNGLTVDSAGNNPKEQTCRGGLAGTEPMGHDEIRKKLLILKDEDSCYTHETYANATTEEGKKSVVNQVNRFLDFVKSLNKSYSLNDHFGISRANMELLDTVCRRDLDEYLSKGLHRKLEEMNGDANERIQESLFFYPFIGMLNALTTDIYNNLHEKGSSFEMGKFLCNEGNGVLKETTSIADAQFRLSFDESEEDSGTFSFCGDTAKALANKDATFDGVASCEGNGIGQNIETITPGTCKPIGNGYWQVIEPAIIKFG